MSRKRKIRREKESEMARQLGVKTLDDKARDLVARGRVGHVEIRPMALTVDADHDGLIAKMRRKKIHFEVAVFLVDSHGIHGVAVVHGAVDIASKGTSLDLTDITRDRQDVRYERPARFVVVTSFSLDSKPEIFEVDANQLRLQNDDSPPFSLDDKCLLAPSWASPHAVHVDNGACLGASLQCIPGVHKHQETSVFKIATDRLDISLSVTIRL